MEATRRSTCAGLRPFSSASRAIRSCGWIVQAEMPGLRLAARQPGVERAPLPLIGL